MVPSVSQKTKEEKRGVKRRMLKLIGLIFIDTTLACGRVRRVVARGWCSCAMCSDAVEWGGAMMICERDDGLERVCD